MPRSTNEPPHEEIPPLVVATLVFDEQIVRAVLIDEDVSNSVSNSYLHHRHDIFPEEQPRRHSFTPMEVDSHVRKSKKAGCRYMVFGTLLVVVALSLLVAMVNYFTRYYLSRKMVSMVELCSISSSALKWESIMVVHIGHLDFVSMNNESVVGMQGETVMETHSLVSGREEIQYVDTNVQSFTLTHSGILVSRQNERVVMLKNKNGVWLTTQEYAMDSEILDSNGTSLVLWFLNDVYVLSQQSQVHVASVEGVTSIKMTQDGIYIFVATEEEVRCFRKDRYERWTAQQSLWRKTDDAGSGREIQENFDETQTELDVSADGSLVSLRRSTGQVLFFTFFRQGMQKLGGGGTMDASHVSVSSNGRRAAVALKSGRVLVYEREDDGMNIVGEILSQNVTLMNFQENRLQIFDGENMTMYENKCDTLLDD